ncbi:TRAP-type C4-dicarboxylate transport system permease small subunit [Sedimentibacter acidaminivorans]|uniref:TRAP-type C4-dicarboxylate transport system permease small subunit n=1 Tax=Sedimentibacter acidaminivorans TaxID=913099 RepID=A0ABS4GG29_9FIRM|nr:TRAP transporter small permease [Sedimentibacter acidaminivorans]MBP1926643.1 TRAP-type C4-dicarboxylate transport system permease small subunit [Sedimentibacter acidaminivorans]
MLLANLVHKASDFVDKICCKLIITILAMMVLTTSLQIVCRVFFSALSWSEELTRYLLVYLTFFGASSVYKRNGHISVLVMQQLLSPKLQKFASIFVIILCGAFFSIATMYGMKYMGLQGSQLSAALRIPMKYVYMSIPIGFSIMILHSVDNVINICFGKGDEN